MMATPIPAGPGLFDQHERITRMQRRRRMKARLRAKVISLAPRTAHLNDERRQ